MAKVHAELRKRDISCVKYHGQLDEDSKHISFEQWMSGQKKLLWQIPHLAWALTSRMYDT